MRRFEFVPEETATYGLAKMFTVVQRRSHGASGGARPQHIPERSAPNVWIRLPIGAVRAIVHRHSSVDMA